MYYISLPTQAYVQCNPRRKSSLGYFHERRGQGGEGEEANEDITEKGGGGQGFSSFLYTISFLLSVTIIITNEYNDATKSPNNSIGWVFTRIDG